MAGGSQLAIFKNKERRWLRANGVFNCLRKAANYMGISTVFTT